LHCFELECNHSLHQILSICHRNRRQLCDHRRLRSRKVQQTSVSKRQHTSAYVSIRSLAYVSKCQHTSAFFRKRCAYLAVAQVDGRHGRRKYCSAYVSIRQHTSAYVSIRQHTSAYVSIRQHTSAYVSLRQHTSAYVSTRQHTSAYVSLRQQTSAYVCSVCNLLQRPRQ
jgi:hypothetical protein